MESPGLGLGPVRSALLSFVRSPHGVGAPGLLSSLNEQRPRGKRELGLPRGSLPLGPPRVSLTRGLHPLGRRLLSFVSGVRASELGCWLPTPPTPPLPPLPAHSAPEYCCVPGRVLRTLG